MLGTYRFCLALLVALSHVGVALAGLNPGVMAVVGFYLISGYVMTGLIRGHYGTLDQSAGFYRDRVLRLFPHYLAIACGTLAWFGISGARTSYLQTVPTWGNLVDNALVVPLNFYMFNHSDAFTLVPPAWSLGAEIQFYIVVPFILLLGLRTPAFVVSLAIYIVASLGVINTDWYGYRLLPGVLWVFLFGSWLFDSHHRSDQNWRGLVACVAAISFALVLAATLAMRGSLMRPYSRETLLGLVAGVAALNALGRRRRHPLDEKIGNLSYGVFLCHFLVAWAFFGGKVNGILPTTLFLGTSVAVAFAMFILVEQPVLRLRHNLRRAARGTARSGAERSLG
jgi:peptidoglycan/LPS O-acetylase OafA/YrhL